ncbi:MAG: type I-A CRISPR-associated protein Cas7/Csa2 [Sulfolobales archaeon]|nr:type I-A CRISPR-associated protein Cas7/Csa2 [Sulfolobales archaeon]
MAGKPSITLSVSARILVNTEALNMAESVGNVTRHRRAPIVVGDQGRYWIVYVPAVSGESIAHHYQRLLASIAASMNLPVTKMDLAGYFLKYSSDDIIKKYYPEVSSVLNLKDVCQVEEELVRASVVADVTGFLYTEKLVKRTSRIRFSYLVPALDAVKHGAATGYPQFHTRYSPGAAREEQALYYVESGSSLYSLSTVLNVSDISELEYCGDSQRISKIASEKPKRVHAALEALLALLDGMIFGAKRSRYLPQWEVKSLVATVSKGPVEFVVSPSVNPNYAEQTARRATAIAKHLGSNIRIFLYDSEGLTISSEYSHTISRYGSHTEALKAAIDEALKAISSGGT